MQYSYDLMAMGTFVDDLDKKISEIGDRCDAARTSAETIRQDFTGDGSDAFDDAHRQWQKDMRTHTDQLKALRDHVATCKRNYEEADRVISEMFPG